MTDGMLVCAGPTMVKDVADSPFEDDMPVAIVNTAIQKLPYFEGDVNLFSLDWPQYLVDLVKEHECRDRIICHGHEENRGCMPGRSWISHGWTKEQAMTIHDLPLLVNSAITMFTALHWLCCKGCKDIRGCGVNLDFYPDGSYHGDGLPFEEVDRKAIKILWERCNDIWQGKMAPFLRKNHIAFTSARFTQVRV